MLQKTFTLSLLAKLLFLFAFKQTSGQSLRPPAYPLITHDPYFSVWSTTDKLADSPTRHWTGKPQSLEGIIRVDGKPYQFLGVVPTTYEPILATGESKPYMEHNQTKRANFRLGLFLLEWTVQPGG